MKEVTIRKPNKDEYETWSILYLVYLDFYKISLTQNQLNKVWSWLFEEPPQINCYLAEIDQRVVGLAHFRRFSRPTEACSGLFLDDLIVLPEFRGQGIGYQLIEAVKSYAENNNLNVVRWITAEDNIQAMRLYDSVATKTTWVTYDAKIEERHV